MSEVAAAAKAGTKQHLLQTIEALDEERIAALSYYAAYLRAQEDAEEDAWYLENEEEIERELEAAKRGDAASKSLHELAAELGIELPATPDASETAPRAPAELGTKEHLVEAIEALDDQSVGALSLYAGYLRVQEEADEEAWVASRAESIRTELQAAARGDVRAHDLEERATEAGAEL